MDCLTEYLGGEPYGKAILTAIEKYGFDKNIQTVYMGVDKKEGEPEQITGVFLFLDRSFLVYSRENQVEIDFLEEVFGIQPPDLVAGRKDNVNIVSWLLTDYEMKNGLQLPDPFIKDENGEDLLQGGREFSGEWSLLVRQQVKR